MNSANKDKKDIEKLPYPSYPYGDIDMFEESGMSEDEFMESLKEPDYLDETDEEIPF